MASENKTSVVVENLDKWYEANLERFQPPVCNHLMFRDQLKVMYVTGPNIRKDYHLELGEELFFQVRGPMCVETWQHGHRKSVPIKEGEIWILPARVPHSPQRFADTLGLVIERERLLTEYDSLRYYGESGDKDDIIFQDSFHCSDLGAQLAPVIRAYFASEAFRTGKADPNHPVPPSPIQVDEQVTFEEPVSLQGWVDAHLGELQEKGALWMYHTVEFRVRVRQVSLASESLSVDKLVWVLSGSAQLQAASDPPVELQAKDHVLVPKSTPHHIVVNDPSSKIIEIWMDPHLHL